MSDEMIVDVSFDVRKLAADGEGRFVLSIRGNTDNIDRIVIQRVDRGKGVYLQDVVFIDPDNPLKGLRFGEG